MEETPELNQEEELIARRRDYSEEICAIVNSDIDGEQLKEALSDYHDNDIASVMPLLSEQQRKKVYEALGAEALSGIFSYLDDVDEYVDELPAVKIAEVVEEMDASDAVDLLEELDEDKKSEILELMDEESTRDVQLLSTYDDDEIGSIMTTDFIAIDKKLSIKEAMRAVIQDAEEKQNITTVYALDKGKYYGAIELRDLVIARSHESLDKIISTSYPVLRDKDKTADFLEEIKQYKEDSMPVVNDDGVLLGVVTSENVAFAVDEELGEDYAKLAGLTEEDDLDEPLKVSVKKRIPWLLTLLVLDVFIGAYVGVYEAVVTAIPMLIFFQSMVLGMSGNTGTQALAVTVRVLSDSGVDAKLKLKLLFKEVRVGFCNGLVMGLLSTIVITIYTCITKDYGNGAFLSSLYIGSTVGIAMLTSMTISSFSGTFIPIVLVGLKADPAVASGPLITTVNDLVAITVYYLIAMAFLMH